MQAAWKQQQSVTAARLGSIICLCANMCLQCGNYIYKICSISFYVDMLEADAPETHIADITTISDLSLIKQT